MEQLLRDADLLAEKGGINVPEDSKRTVLRGDIKNALAVPANRLLVRVFTSSTFGDTRVSFLISLKREIQERRDRQKDRQTDRERERNSEINGREIETISTTFAFQNKMRNNGGGTKRHAVTNTDRKICVKNSCARFLKHEQ